MFAEFQDQSGCPLEIKEQMEDVFISLESNQNDDKINTPVNPGLSEKEKKSSRALIPATCIECMKTHNPTSPESQGDFVYFFFRYLGFQLFFMAFPLEQKLSNSSVKLRPANYEHR